MPCAGMTICLLVRYALQKWCGDVVHHNVVILLTSTSQQVIELKDRASVRVVVSRFVEC